MASRERDIGRSYASGSHNYKRKNILKEEERKKKDAESSKKITDMFVKPTAVSTVTAANNTTELESSEVEDTPPSTPTSPTPAFCFECDSIHFTNRLFSK